MSCNTYEIVNLDFSRSFILVNSFSPHYSFSQLPIICMRTKHYQRIFHGSNNSQGARRETAGMQPKIMNPLPPPLFRNITVNNHHHHIFNTTLRPRSLRARGALEAAAVGVAMVEEEVVPPPTALIRNSAPIRRRRNRRRLRCSPLDLWRPSPKCRPLR